MGPAALLSIVLPWALAQAAPAPQELTFALRISIATADDGQPAATREWLAGQLAEVARLFDPAGVAFSPGDGETLDAAHAHVETRADRDWFSGHVKPHAVDVFVVSSLRDVDDPAQMRRGVHWHAPGGAHYVVLIGTAGPSVLAHELGHYFGNPHSKVVDNVMSYERSGAPPFFDAPQRARIAARARAYVSSGELLLTASTQPPFQPTAVH